MNRDWILIIKKTTTLSQFLLWCHLSSVKLFYSKPLEGIYIYIYVFWIGCFRLSLVVDYPCWVYHKLSGYRLIILFMIKQCSSKFCFQFMMKVLLAWIFCFWLPNIQNLDQQSYNILCRYFLFYLHFTVTTWVIMTCYSHCLSADKSKDLSSSFIW